LTACRYPAPANERELLKTNHPQMNTDKIYIVRKKREEREQRKKLNKYGFFALFAFFADKK